MLNQFKDLLLTIYRAALSEFTTEIGILNLTFGVIGTMLAFYYINISHKQALAMLKIKNANNWVDSFNQVQKGASSITLFVIMYFLVSIFIASANQ